MAAPVLEIMDTSSTAVVEGVLVICGYIFLEMCASNKSLKGQISTYNK
jgi:hypothetical protein